MTNYTTQIFFSDADNIAVLTGAAPYNTRSPKTDPTTDETDNVLTSSADATNIVPVAGSIAAGYAATFTIGLSGRRLERDRRLPRPTGPSCATLESATVVHDRQRPDGSSSRCRPARR